MSVPVVFDAKQSGIGKPSCRHPTGIFAQENTLSSAAYAAKKKFGAIVIEVAVDILGFAFWSPINFKKSIWRKKRMVEGFEILGLSQTGKK